MASEGSIGPHPSVPWATLDHEFVVLVDKDRGTVVVGAATALDIIAVSFTARTGGDLATRLAGADLPTHGVVVAPNAGPARPVHRALRIPEDIAAAVADCAAVSPDGRARIETDFRAHLCPSRQRVIASAAANLAARLASTCPTCATPGWGQVRVLTGLPCSWCGQHVPQPRAALDACAACPFILQRPLVPPGTRADPASCNFCNP